MNARSLVGKISKIPEKKRGNFRSKPGKIRVLILLLLLLFSFCITISDGIMVSRTVPDLVSESGDIVTGSITGTRSQWDASHLNIQTVATVRVQTVEKGSLVPNTSIEVMVLGGSLDGQTQWVEDMPVLVNDTDVGLFLRTPAGQVSLTNQSNLTGTAGAPAGLYKITGAHQGVYPLGKTSADGNETNASRVNREIFIQMVTAGEQGIATDTPAPRFTKGETVEGNNTLAAVPSISSVTPATASAGTETIITISGRGFGTKPSRESYADIGFSYQSDPVVPIYASGYPYFSFNSNDIVSWSDTRIVVQLPTGICPDGYPGSASSGYVYVLTEGGQVSNLYPFTVTFGYWKKSWDGPAGYVINPGGVSGSLAAIKNAATSWNLQIPGSFFRFDYAGTTTSTVFGQDGQSLISFAPAEVFYDPNIIAQASSWPEYQGSIITEADIRYNSGFPWTTGTASGDTMNIEAITLHEMGHWLMLSDLYGRVAGYPSDISPEKKAMFGLNNDIYGNKNQKTLSTSEVAAIRWIYPDYSDPGKIGVYRDGSWYIDRNGDGSVTTGDALYSFGAALWTPVVGDWDGNGEIEIGVYRDGTWYLDLNHDGLVTPGDALCRFGSAQWTPVVGDWDGNGETEIGVYRNGVWYLDLNGDGAVTPGDALYGFGAAQWTPVVGDWDGNGETEIAVYRDGTWYVDLNGDGAVTRGDALYGFGAAQWTPVVGDWDGYGETEIGVYRNGVWYLDLNGDGAVTPGDARYSFGAAQWNPIVGDWEADGANEIGVYRNGAWYLDVNGNGLWGGGDRFCSFGTSGWIPVVGKWA